MLHSLKFQGVYEMKNITLKKPLKFEGKSIMGMMSLGLDLGEEVTVIADGVDEAVAVENIERYLNGVVA